MWPDRSPPGGVEASHYVYSNTQEHGATFSNLNIVSIRCAFPLRSIYSLLTGYTQRKLVSWKRFHKTENQSLIENSILLNYKSHTVTRNNCCASTTNTKLSWKVSRDFSFLGNLPSSDLKTETVHFSETSVSTYESERHHKLEEQHRYLHRRGNLLLGDWRCTAFLAN